MNYLAVIPARGGSKGIPKKNIADVAGKPLVAWTILAAKNCSQIGMVIVSTDCDEIAKIAESYGAIICKRPTHLAEDETPTLPVIQHAVEFAKKHGFFADAVLTLQPTSPLRSSTHLTEAIKLFSVHTNADSLVSTVRVPHHFVPDSLMMKDGEYVTPLNSSSPTRRQDKKTFFARNGAGIYITRTNKISDFIWGGKTIGFEMDKISSLDIDDFEDLKMASFLLKSELFQN